MDKTPGRHRRVSSAALVGVAVLALFVGASSRPADAAKRSPKRKTPKSAKPQNLRREPTQPNELALQPDPTTTTVSTKPATTTSAVPVPDLPTEYIAAAVGDMACPPGSVTTPTTCRQDQVSNLIVMDRTVQSLLLLGDLQYNTGQLSAFRTSYEQSFGRLNAMAIPSPGNHEYGTEGAAGYYEYFGAKAHRETNGYYSLDLSKSWHVVVLNSNCAAIGGCGIESAQYTWLVSDLAANKRPCTVAIWHHPLFTSAVRGSNTLVKPLWEALEAANADLVLNGHEHHYERFAPQRADGTAESNGIRQIVVGTGGITMNPFATPVPNSEFRGHGFGFLRLDLKTGGFTWRFVGDPDTINFTDAGADRCH
jgi:Calcineurin-like phosphoesterase